MLSRVEVRTTQGDLITLTLEDSSNGLVVQNITGIDPVDAVLVSTSFAAIDGEQYLAARRNKRNIVFTLGLNPSDGNVRALRHQLYNFFMPKSIVELNWVDDDTTSVTIEGHIEKMETALFSQTPAVNISVMCFDPDFYDPTPVDVTGMLTSDTVAKSVTYAGTVETGVTLTVNVNRSLSEFTVYHKPPNDNMRTLDFSYPLIAGDVLVISTVPGAKGAYLTRAGTQSAVLYGLSPQSNWLSLEPGVNTLLVQADGAGVPLTFEYVNKYGGL